MRKYHKQQGYTLVEVVIVISIIALLVGGTFTATTLIRKIRLTKVVEQAEEIHQQVQTFRDMYKAWPGDFDRAEDVWGSAADCNAAATDKTTCNGNGNGVVQLNGEEFRLWQHLANAELYGGQWTGVEASPDRFNGWESVPAGPITNSVYAFHGDGTEYGTSGHRVYYAAEGDNLGNAIIAPSELAALDDKFDDGIAITGRINALSGSGGTGSCVTLNVYERSNDQEACTMVYWMQ